MIRIMKKMKLTNAQPLIARPKKNISSLISNQESGTIKISTNSAIRIVKSVFITRFVLICEFRNNK